MRKFNLLKYCLLLILVCAPLLGGCAESSAADLNFACSYEIDAAMDGDADTYWLLREIGSTAAEGRFVNRTYDDMESLWFYYDKSAAFLKELRDSIGADEFLRILAVYCGEYKYKTATTDGFLEILRRDSVPDVEGIIEKYIK